ncbi:MAG: OmpA family protein [Alphaproteobacteria bacterium]|nr:OmpA family protein [Alphaproteobacteria bacterium]
MKSIARIAMVFAALLLPAVALADKNDARGSKDHPLLTRYPDSIITDYQHNYNSVPMTVGANADGTAKVQNVEGQMTAITYFYHDADKQPSPLQLLRNYEAAIKDIKGEVVFERLPKEGDGGEATLKVTTGGKDVWVKVEPEIWSAPTQSYKLTIVEVESMAQVVSANAMLDALNKDGFIALYINFDTNKSDLKADGEGTVKEIVSLMHSSPDLKLSIEGHTDNVGTAAANQKLSEARARAVMAAVIKAGIDKSRLTAKGLGQTVPIADNRTEDGRAKNRRVELVKQK